MQRIRAWALALEAFKEPLSCRRASFQAFFDLLHLLGRLVALPPLKAQGHGERQQQRGGGATGEPRGRRAWRRERDPHLAAVLEVEPRIAPEA